MYKIIARIFDGKQLVGYRIVDELGSITDITISEAWRLAKNKQIVYVTAIGNENEPGLSGVYGFELRKLPEMQYKDIEKRIEQANNIHDKLSNIPDNLIQSTLSAEPTEAELAKLERNMEAFAFNTLLKEAGYERSDLDKLLAKTNGDTAEEKTANLIKFLENKKLKLKAKELRRSKGFKGLIDVFKR